MKAVLDKLKNALDTAGAVQFLEPAAEPETIAEWESEKNAVLPAEIKEFLQFSNGFEYGMNFMVFPLGRIRIIRDWVGVPDGWLHLGQLIGDGCYIVSDENGELYKCDHESRPMLEKFPRERFAEWIEDHVLESIYEDYDVFE